MAMLVYMKPEIMEALKNAAAASDQDSCESVEQAAIEALKTKRD